MTTITVRTMKTLSHHWPDGPSDDEYHLRNLHTHNFIFELTVKVRHYNRDKEFFRLRDILIGMINTCTDNYDTKDWSCEKWAVMLYQAAENLQLNTYQVKVGEDDYQWATYTKEEEEGEKR